MTQLTKTRFQSEVDRILIDNVNNAIEASDVNMLLTDLSDSTTFLPTPGPPSIRSFTVGTFATRVDPLTVIDGLFNINYSVDNPDQVVGMLTLSDTNGVISTTIDPNATSAEVLLSEIVLMAGDSITFTLGGTDGTTPFSRTYTIQAIGLDEFLYFGTVPTNDPTMFDASTNSRIIGELGVQQITLSVFTGSAYLIILQNNNLGALTSIEIDGVNQIDAFTVAQDAQTIATGVFTAWISNHQLLGSVVSGDIITLRR